MYPLVVRILLSRNRNGNITEIDSDRNCGIYRIDQISSAAAQFKHSTVWVEKGPAHFCNLLVVYPVLFKKAGTFRGDAIKVLTNKLLVSCLESRHSSTALLSIDCQ